MTVARGAEPARILVRLPNWLGDVVMATPGLRALRARHPHARIVAQVAAPWAPLVEGHPAIDEVWALPADVRRPRGMRSAARRVRAEHFDLGIAIPESISSALLMRLGRVSRIVGYARDPVRRMLLHRPLPAPEAWGRRRWVSKERFVLGLMGAIGARSEDTRLELHVTSAAERALEAALRATGAAGEAALGRPPVVLAPGASFGSSKCWPVGSFAALGDRLAARGEPIVLVGSGVESERVERVRRVMRSPAASLAGTLDTGGLAALLARARLLVTNDAGARHVAVALGTPSVVFFGPTALEKTGENLALVESLETEHGCRPCYRRVCPIDHRCLREIAVDEALAAVDRASRRVERSGDADAGPRRPA